MTMTFQPEIWNLLVLLHIRSTRYMRKKTPINWYVMKVWIIRLRHLCILKKESPPVWMQEAYHPLCIKYSICCPIPGGGERGRGKGMGEWGGKGRGWVPHHWTGGVSHLPPGWGSPHMNRARVPPPTSWTWPGVPPGVNRLKTLPSPSFRCGR